VSPLELVDDRFEKLAAELREARPVAPAELRENVVTLEPPVRAHRRRPFGRPSRRLVFAIAAAAVLGSFVAAMATSHSGKSTNSSGASEAFAPAVTTPRSVASGRLGAAAPGRGSAAALYPTSQKALDVAPTPGRLQRYDVTMRLRVKDVDALSDAAKSAMDLTRGLGGYVASAQYATSGGKRGGATFVLRVPAASVQTELAGLTRLGTILQQRTGILDVTKRVDREAQQIAKLQRELDAVGAAEAAAIRHRLQSLEAKHARLLKSAHFARITLALATPQKAAVPTPSGLGRAFGDAGSVLLRELQILLYAFAVAGPLLLVAGVGIAAARVQRRRSYERLLERA